MKKLKENILALVEEMERGADLEEARRIYAETIAHLPEASDREGPLAIAMVELKEMLFVHPYFSEGMRIRDIRTSLSVIRDELEDLG